jgi:hypothetical protein
MSDLVEKARDFLFTRQQAYQQVFSLESIAGVRVLEDLAEFCRANESTFHPDPRTHALCEGRREVWLRIASHLNLNQETIWKLYGRKG